MSESDSSKTRNPSSSVLHFWFGALDERGHAAPSQRKLWFAKDADFDAAITRKFSWVFAELVTAGMGQPHWVQCERDRMASVIVLDQFSRNMFRGTPSMFVADPLARAYAFEIIALGEDRHLPFSMRSFSYMPLMHSESLDHQERCIELFKAFAQEVEDDEKEQIDFQLKFAHQHRDIVARFGRFPHRNEVLGRVSTEEELAFLSESGSSF